MGFKGEGAVKGDPEVSGLSGKLVRHKQTWSWWLAPEEFELTIQAHIPRMELEPGVVSELERRL